MNKAGLPPAHKGVFAIFLACSLKLAYSDKSAPNKPGSAPGT